MTEPLDTVSITRVAYSCRDQVTNLMTESEIRAIVNEAIIRYNDNTPVPTDPSIHGPIDTDSITDAEDAVINLMKAYVRGQLPSHVESVIDRIEFFDDEQEIVPEGEEIPQPTPEPSPVTPTPTPAPSPVSPTPAPTPTPTPSPYGY